MSRFRRGGLGSGGGGGLYSGFVSASSSSSSKSSSGSQSWTSSGSSSSGAAIPPPDNVTHHGSGSRAQQQQQARPGFAPIPSAPSSSAHPFAPPSSYAPTGAGAAAGKGLSKHGYSTMQSISAASQSHYSGYVSGVEGGVNKRNRSEDDYFNDDDDDDYAGGAYSKSSSSRKRRSSSGDRDRDRSSKHRKKEESDDEDPLDAFMANLEKDVQEKGVKKVDQKAAEDANALSSSAKKGSSKGVRQDIEEADDEESYYEWLEENPNAGRADDDEEIVEYDADGNPVFPNRKHIDPLPPVNHNEVEYDAFEKNFYAEHPDIATLSNIQVIDLRQKLNVKVSGALPPKPVTSFAHFGLDDSLMKAIRKSEFTQPTPIQAQGIPALLSGRDVIGLAKTGSGKTAAFLWPMIAHIMDQPRLLRGDGPIGLVLVPTRELALQIFGEARKFGKAHNLEVVCAYGGGSKWEQSKSFERGAEIAIATPGRMIDFIKMKVTNLQRVTYLVLDEADRMFDMGFEPQVRSICNHVRPDRQAMLFSATFKKRIERLARDVLSDPVKIVQGSVGEASEDVTQVVKVMGTGGYKWQWLTSSLVGFTSAGSVLVFVTKKQNCEELAQNLKVKEFECRCIHGDLTQHERNDIISCFKKQEFPILVATDVAARGLDIPHIRTVVNFDVARDIDTHTHRVGRTGRAGVKGTAYTLVTDKDKEFAGHIVRNLESANQEVPKDLMDLAMKSAWFKNSRFKRGKVRNPRDRAGLGMGSSSSSSSSEQQQDTSDPLSSSTATPAAGRISTMKVAFKNSYLSNFRKASSATDTSTVGEAGVYASKQEQLMPAPPSMGGGGGATSEQPTNVVTAEELMAQQKSGKRRSRWE